MWGDTGIQLFVDGDDGGHSTGVKAGDDFQAETAVERDLAGQNAQPLLKCFKDGGRAFDMTGDTPADANVMATVGTVVRDRGRGMCAWRIRQQGNHGGGRFIKAVVELPRDVHISGHSQKVQVGFSKHAKDLATSAHGSHITRMENQT